MAVEMRRPNQNCSNMPQPHEQPLVGCVEREDNGGGQVVRDDREEVKGVTMSDDDHQSRTCSRDRNVEQKGHR
jgi:hypothetical protein